MKPSDYRVLIRGAGELASGTAHHLYTQGFQNILMLERRYPKAVRRQREASVSVRVRDGIGVIEELFVDDVPIHQWLAENASEDR